MKEGTGILFSRRKQNGKKNALKLCSNLVTEVFLSILLNNFLLLFNISAPEGHRSTEEFRVGRLSRINDLRLDFDSAGSGRPFSRAFNCLLTFLSGIELTKNGRAKMFRREEVNDN